MLSAGLVWLFLPTTDARLPPFIAVSSFSGFWLVLLYKTDSFFQNQFHEKFQILTFTGSLKSILP